MFSGNYYDGDSASVSALAHGNRFIVIVFAHESDLGWIRKFSKPESAASHSVQAGLLLDSDQDAFATALENATPTTVRDVKLDSQRVEATGFTRFAY